MEITAVFQRLCLVKIRRLLMVISVAIIIAALFQCFALHYGKRLFLSSANEGSIVMLISNATFSNNSRPRPIYVSNIIANATYSSDLAEEVGEENKTKATSVDIDLSSDKNEHNKLMVKTGVLLSNSWTMGNDASTGDSSTQATATEIEHGSFKQPENMNKFEAAIVPVPKSAVSITLNNKSQRDSISTLKRWKAQPTSISQMNLLLLQSFSSSHNMRPKWSSARDRELLSAKLKIENAPISQKDLGVYLKNYVDLVAQKYIFWNRTGGADHFLVGCHDWASQITRQHMKNCIRVLCNANVGKGFKIGKDTTLPVTYIRSAENPLKDLGGRPPSERPILAFFAGGMHGYLRPILLQFWENKESDMKIFGPMPRDTEGKWLYREYMKSSKYCICARGYEVHTPRIVEAILYECVPVIISDSYVPPFFEVLNWEAFAVFVQEKDIPNLRNILLSIPKEKYFMLQSSVKMVQQHFLWHKNPVKYDIFHMILHSVWYNRIFQIRSR
ncbi:hypothetical protein JCGZ_07294 [Jatropha curcas]|uniref:Exostosin GT47 domain-containing protein n=1 Tax=Jatropha curcas TaxID=180498 RepID=A0A067KFJ0_JATCU|nr:hypothetical protein JCGZ_07294 [Jatropha curcas]